MRIIELLGLPGSGKSTNSEQMQHYLCEKGLCVYSRKDIQYLQKGRISRSFIKASLASKNRELMRYTMPLVLRGDSTARNKLFFLSRFVVTYENLCRCMADEQNEDAVAVLDEGPFQYITSFCYKQQLRDNKVAPKLIRFVESNLQTTVLYLDLPIEESLSRIRNRNRKSDRYNNAPNDVIDLLERKRENIDYLFNTIEGEKFRVDASKPLSELQAQIADLLF